ncbi:MAG: hypothetical protein SOU84_02970 [Candidatus Faecimonas sp.]|nr:hypothetical protein [Mycoplasmatota bacterium]MDY2908102.1 hypothetical protein [Candidatus Faecimonas sp.]
MLVLPIVNHGRIMHVKISLKDAEKIYNSVILEGTKESDVIVNQQLFSESSYLDDKENNSVVKFIRNTSLVSRNDFLVTTREEAESNRYDVYRVKQPPKFINLALDNLYASVITDMRKEIPNNNVKPHYVSFEKLGFNEALTDEKIARLQQIVQEEKDRSRWPRLFEQAGIADIPYMLEFLNHFDCTVISNTTLPEATLQSILALLEPTQISVYKEASKYYKIAKSNEKIYDKLKVAYHSIYQGPYRLIMSEKQKKQEVSSLEKGWQKVKLPNEVGEVHDYVTVS